MAGSAVLVVATAEQVVPSLRAAGTLVLKPLNASGVRAFAQLYSGETRGRRRAGRAPDGSERRLAAAAARRGVGVGAHAGAAPPRRFGRPRDHRQVGTARRRGRPGREHRQAAGGQGAHRVARARRRRRGRLPVQGAGLVRGRRRGLLLRPRAVRGRAGRAGDGHPVPGDRRAVRQRQVLGTARRPARCARRRRAPR